MSSSNPSLDYATSVILYYISYDFTHSYLYNELVGETDEKVKRELVMSVVGMETLLEYTIEERNIDWNKVFDYINEANKKESL